MPTPLSGKYRGTVVDSADPMHLGRVRVSVPSVTDNVAWAMPCVPYAGHHPDMRQIPPAGTHVWVEFEHSDVTQPIWVGCFWVK
jgi:hypothetical protein